MRRDIDLKNTLRRIDRRGYKAYKDIAGAYDCGSHTLHIDYVQGDPFASPSKVRLRVAQEIAKFPQHLYSTAVRRIALEDFLAREGEKAVRKSVRGRRGSGKSGIVRIDAGAQEVLERSAARVCDDWVEIRLSVGLPADGRRVLAREAEALLLGELVEVAESVLFYSALKQEELRFFVECIENQESIRSALDERGLVAFVADGSILPRESGVSDRAMPSNEAILFESPRELSVSFKLPNTVRRDGVEVSEISGMGIPRGVTLIVGGGYHGKSTLLRAIERGVYPHIPGDGREYVVSNKEVVKIRAEDGRRVEHVDISPFITNLPKGRDTASFSTEDASGSTSQAANIVEAIEVGAAALLIDEDTSATNFMIRDARMQSLVHKESEPITPFLDRVRELYTECGISSVLVVGGCGDYFDVADTIIMMKEFRPETATEEAREIAARLPSNRLKEIPAPFAPPLPRVPARSGFDASRGRREVKIDAKALDLVLYGSEPIELRAVEQLVDISQTRAVGYAIYLASSKFVDGKRTLSEVLDCVEEYLESKGVDALDPFRRGESHPGAFARPRRFEIAAAINRLRSLRIEQARVGRR